MLALLTFSSVVVFILPNVCNTSSEFENLVRGEHYEPRYKFDSRCSLKVVVDNRNQSWDGHIQFLADDKEILYLGLYVTQKKIAVRNKIYNSEAKYGDTWYREDLRIKNVMYQDVGRQQSRVYNLTFGPENFEIRSEGKVIVTLRYEDLTKKTYDMFIESINFVRFILTDGRGLNPIFLQFTQLCRGEDERKLKIAEYNKPTYSYDTRCDLRVVVKNRTKKWNGDVKFFAGNREMLAIGLHPEYLLPHNNLAYSIAATRTDSVSRWKWTDATYPVVEQGGSLIYDFNFNLTTSSLRLKSNGLVIKEFSHDDFLVGGKFLDLRAIDSVSFKLGEISSGPEPVFISDFKTLQLAISCPDAVYKRENFFNEIQPTNVEFSNIYEDDMDLYDASHAIDHNYRTISKITTGSDGSNPWIKLNLDKVYCIREVAEYKKDRTPQYIWTCSDRSCLISNCAGGVCDSFIMKVESGDTEVKLNPYCKDGDSVTLERTHSGAFVVAELAIQKVTCEAGAFKDSTESCKPCPPDEVSMAGAPNCTKCPSGTTANKDRTICERKPTSHLTLDAWSWIVSGVFLLTSMILAMMLTRKFLKRRCRCHVVESEHEYIDLTAPRLPAQAAPSPLPLTDLEKTGDRKSSSTKEPVYVNEEPEPVYINEEPEAVYVNEEPEAMYVNEEPEAVYINEEPEAVYINEEK